jgi:hypothetical protein
MPSARPLERCAVAVFSAGLLAACRTSPREEEAVPTPPVTVVAPTAAEIARSLGKPAPDLPAAQSLTMTWNPGHRVDMRSAVAVADRGLLKVVASKRPNLTCDHVETPSREEWMSFELDPGPRGDFYMGHATPVAMSFAVSNDIAPWRETYAAHSRVEIMPFTANDERGELRVQWRRVLHNPDPKVLTTVIGAGAIPLTLCKSARDLLGQPAASVAAEPVTVRVGDTTFTPARVLAFAFDDGKNGPVISSIGFYASPDADCDATTREISDDGGGVNGLQVTTGQFGAAPNALNVDVPQPVNLDVNDVTAGGHYFEIRPQTPERLFGTVTLTAGTMTGERGSIAGWIHVDGRTLGPRAADAVIDGTFVAPICKRTFW